MRRRGGDAGAASSAPVPSRGCCASAGSAIPRPRARFLQPVARSSARSDARWPTWASAVDRILARHRAAASGSPIHGDYDVDGITSTVILRRALELLGADVVHFIPERLRDGYGLQPAAHRAPARRGRRAGRLGGLRHPRRRRGAPRARARRRSDHHRPPRAGRRAAAGARRHQPEARTTARIPTSTWPASASR